MFDKITQNYTSDFYERQRNGSLRSALSVLPVVFDLFKPNSIVDFGCGVGTWLAAAKEFGVEHCLGLEGPWVQSQTLALAGLEIQETNLENSVLLGRRFDLAMSLEVAEHLMPKRADSFVDDLCQASSVVLFGAAAPGDDGDGHQNEQWISYWAEKFVRRGYMPLDLVRPVIRNRNQIDYWYRTNIVLYAEPKQAEFILKNSNIENFRNLDLPRQIEIIGLKEARKHFMLGTRSLYYWTSRRLMERLKLR